MSVRMKITNYIRNYKTNTQQIPVFGAVLEVTGKDLCL
jgi:hypothetical protein